LFFYFFSSWKVGSEVRLQHFDQGDLRKKSSFLFVVSKVSPLITFRFPAFLAVNSDQEIEVEISTTVRLGDPSPLVHHLNNGISRSPDVSTSALELPLAFLLDHFPILGVISWNPSRSELTYIISGIPVQRLEGDTNVGWQIVFLSNDVNILGKQVCELLGDDLEVLEVLGVSLT
jgi:hypothetical protein